MSKGSGSWSSKPPLPSGQRYGSKVKPGPRVQGTYADDGAADEAYRWEGGYEKTWEAISEDAQGSVGASIAEIVDKNRRKRLEERRAAGHVRLGIMRHLYLIVDLSECMRDPDMKPTRVEAVGRILKHFLDAFFDGNPMSQIGWIVTRSKRAEVRLEMNGNLWRHLEFVKEFNETTKCEGEPSLQNALNLAYSTLQHMPTHTSKEIIVIMGSLTSCDPGNIYTTIENLKTSQIRCSVISLAAEVRIYKMLAKETGGTCHVILDAGHMQDLLQAQVDPPHMSGGKFEVSMIKMGFPQKGHSGDAALCICHLDDQSKCKFEAGGYICPQCNNKYCDLPTECKVCGLSLVAAPHVARSFLHIFPLEPFEEIAPLHGQCFGCIKILPDKNKHIYNCKNCNKKFCLDCDLFLHEVLHSCTGCSAMSNYNVLK